MRGYDSGHREDTPDIPWTELATDVQLVTELVTGGYFTQVIPASREWQEGNWWRRVTPHDSVRPHLPLSALTATLVLQVHMGRGPL